MPSVALNSPETTLRIGYLQHWKIEVVQVQDARMIVRSTSTDTLLEVQEGLIFRTVGSRVVWRMPPGMQVPVGFKRQRSKAKTGLITRQGAQEFLQNIATHPIPAIHALRGVGAHPYYLSSRVRAYHGIKPNIRLGSVAVLSRVVARNDSGSQSDYDTEADTDDDTDADTGSD